MREAASCWLVHGGRTRSPGAGVHRFVLALGIATALFMVPGPGAAQLISPGKLSAPHAALEGITNCIRCHEPGHAGPAASRCLACHVPLQRRIAAGKGYHASIAARPCEDCHREHFGRDFALVRLDTATFQHGATGFVLRGAHARAACRDCHQPDRIVNADVRQFKGRYGALGRTMLGLSTACSACHRSDDPHGGQFGTRECSDCHDESDWKHAVRFDHGATRFELTGAHARVTCGACHHAERPGGPVRFAGLSFSSCTSCHRDPHDGAMGSSCTGCHTTGSWQKLDRTLVERRFDHSRTGFELQGAHASLHCAACHGGADVPGIGIRFVAGTQSHTYPRPTGHDCASCHLDAHHGAFAGSPRRAECDRCHTQSAWTPTTFGLEQHDSTQFRLTGAHRAVPCDGCHRSTQPGKPPQLRMGDTDCRACHAKDDPHHGSFGSESCGHCHQTDSFRVKSFDHAGVQSSQCDECHAKDSPHREQFGETSCASCHDTHTFRIARFDHSRTRFPLTGKHAALPCASCHHAEREPDGSSMVLYRPLPTNCSGCHGGGR